MAQVWDIFAISLRQTLQLSLWKTMMGSGSNSTRRASSSGVSQAGSSSRRIGSTSVISSKPSSILNTKQPLAPIRRTSLKYQDKTITPSPRYNSKDTKRLVPSGLVLLDKANTKSLNSPRPSRDYGKNGVSSSRNSLDAGSPRTTRDSSSSDTTPSSKSPDSLEKKLDEPKKAPPPPALRLDFIKAALSNNKQVYSNQQIREKAAAWTADKQPQSPKKQKPKSQQSSNASNKVQSDAASDKQNLKNTKLYDNLKNEGFAPRGKSNELNIQLKALRQRLGAESLEEESVEEVMASAQTAKSKFGASSLFGY